MRTSLLGLVMLALGSSVVLGACGGSDEDDTGTAGTGGGSGSGGGSSACQPKLDDCYAAGPEGPGKECLAKADFSGADVTMLRVSSHQVASPAALAQPFVQDTVISKKSALKEPECNINGAGQFNLLMSIDTVAKELTLGGGVPQALVGPAKQGTCWASFTDEATSIEVSPFKATYTESNGTLSADFPSFVMPIYLEDEVSTNGDTYVLVPLHELTVTAKLSADKNCIGRYAAETLSPDFSCQPDQGEFSWETGGRYEGYITVEEADDVFVVSLGQSLCVVLTGDPSKWKGTPDNNCKTAPAFANEGLPKGDWCSTTNSAGGCQDSWRLVIDIAAQAIDIRGDYDAATNTCPE
jgi:hypothetical protein